MGEIRHNFNSLRFDQFWSVRAFPYVAGLVKVQGWQFYDECEDSFHGSLNKPLCLMDTQCYTTLCSWDFMFILYHPCGPSTLKIIVLGSLLRYCDDLFCHHCVPLQLVFEAAGEQEHMGLVIVSKTRSEKRLVSMCIHMYVYNIMYECMNK